LLLVISSLTKSHVSSTIELENYEEKLPTVDGRAYLVKKIISIVSQLITTKQPLSFYTKINKELKFCYFPNALFALMKNTQA
jgi:hypothetical protein